ncbi:MAG: MATE family efflux transporter [Eubacterium sp.]
MYYDLTKGKISKSLIMFTIPMIAGDLLQQFYNIADTLIVGQVLGKNALAAVGSAYTLMIFLTSIFLGLSMGAGALFSIYRGNDSDENLRIAVGQAFSLIMLVTIVLNIAVYILINPIMIFLQVPDEVYRGMKIYLLIIFIGLIATSLQFFSFLLKTLGILYTDLLAVSTVLNIGLDLLFVMVFHENKVLPFGNINMYQQLELLYM